METTSEKRLTYQEKKFAIQFAENFQFHVGKRNAVTSVSIMDSYNQSKGMKLSRGKVRDIFNYCRVHGLLRNVVAGNEGYWIEPAQKVRDMYVKTLQSRMREIGKIIKSVDTSFDTTQLTLF